MATGNLFAQKSLGARDEHNGHENVNKQGFKLRHKENAK
jgi:hypothetical protein